MLALSQAPCLIEHFPKLRTESKCQTFMSKNFHRRFIRVMVEYKYERIIYVDPLLAIYTIGTLVYGALQIETSPDANLLFLRLSELFSRAYVGQTYSGASMTYNDIGAYR